jgi:hypothetical protein
VPRRQPAADAVGAAKLSLTLSAEAAYELRQLADKQGVSLAEVIRRAMTLYRFAVSLPDDEEIIVHNKSTGQTSHVLMVGM